jgi:hypothetical protein
VLAEYKEIQEALRFEREEAATSFAALVKPRILKRVILGMGELRLLLLNAFTD